MNNSAISKRITREYLHGQLLFTVTHKHLTDFFTIAKVMEACQINQFDHLFSLFARLNTHRTTLVNGDRVVVLRDRERSLCERILKGQISLAEAEARRLTREIYGN